MRLNNYPDRNQLLVDWILQTLPEKAAVLDIGANDGTLCPQVAQIAARAAHFAGVDPDANVLARNILVQTKYPSTLEKSDIPAAAFDCAYSIYVFEHVADERAFLKAAARVLKPGGSLFFITPNGRHYFAALASMFAKLRIQDKVLRMIRPSQLVDEYHYPALYRLNTEPRLVRLGKEAGFSQFEFRYSERIEEFACYFPRPLRIFPAMWEVVARSMGVESMLGNLMGRMVKG
jgi:ubiquinone/menaquinone biosynthesis C-methylase UbiE